MSRANEQGQLAVWHSMAEPPHAGGRFAPQDMMSFAGRAPFQSCLEVSAALKGGGNKENKDKKERTRMMRLPLLISALALLLSACARDVETQVTRFHEGALPAGETFTVEPAKPEMRGPEFRSYAQLVRDEMRQYGFETADGDPDLRVVADYGVSEGRTKVESYGGYGYPFYSYRFGTFHPFHHGFVHPHHFGGYYGPEIRSDTVYTRTLRLKMIDTSSGEVVFEGRAISEGPTQELSTIMPYLVESMFRNFPGESGATKVVEIEGKDGGQRY